jgi:hypothetical protein
MHVLPPLFQLQELQARYDDMALDQLPAPSAATPPSSPPFQILHAQHFSKSVNELAFAKLGQAL